MTVLRAPVRILVVDDHPEFIEATRAWIGSDPRLSFAGEAGDGLEAVELALLLRPDVVLMDVVMPHCDGFDATRRIKAQADPPAVVMISFADSEPVRHAASCSGADAFLAKGSSADQLLDTLLTAGGWTTPTEISPWGQGASSGWDRAEGPADHVAE